MSPMFPQRNHGNGSDGEGLPFVKIKSGESVTGVFRGIPVEFFRHWDNAQKRSHPCTRNEEFGCARCEEGERGSWRFRTNFVTKGDNGMEAKVFEGGSKIWDQLSNLDGEYDLQTWAVRISRMGSTMNDTVYTVMPLPTGKLQGPGLAAVEAVPLLQLDADLKPAAPQEEQQPEPDDSQDIPF